MADIQVPEVKTRVATEKGTFVLDAAVWPQCGRGFPVSGGQANQKFQSSVLGTPVSSVNLVFSDDQTTAYIDVTLS